MKLFPKICCLLALLFLCAVDVNGQHATQNSGADTIRVSGLVDHPFGISGFGTDGVSLKPAPAHEMRNLKGELKKAFPAAKAFLLKDIVEKASPVVGGHKEEGKVLVVVTAVDGYTVVFSYGELMYGSAGGDTWLMPVSQDATLRGDGPFVLLSMSDTVSAPRYVKWVKSIDVRKI